MEDTGLSLQQTLVIYCLTLSSYITSLSHFLPMKKLNICQWLFLYVLLFMDYCKDALMFLMGCFLDFSLWPGILQRDCLNSHSSLYFLRKGANCCSTLPYRVNHSIPCLLFQHYYFNVFTAIFFVCGFNAQISTTRKAMCGWNQEAGTLSWFPTCIEAELLEQSLV